MTKIGISIIVPCYNQSEYLADALDSILAQTYPNWECIIVNDGSTDNTGQIAEKYTATDTRFKYLYKENGGLSSARNAGIKIGVGEYILPLDADDKIGPYYIEKALNVFNEDSTVTLVYSKAKLFGINNHIWNLRPYTYKELLKSNMIFCSAIFKKSDFDNCGGYDNELKTGFEDWDLYIRMLNEKSIVFQLQDFHFYYRIKSESMLQSIGQKQQNHLNNYLYHKHIDIYKTYFANPIELLRQIDMYETMYKNSFNYKLGSIILKPVRLLFSTIKSFNK